MRRLVIAVIGTAVLAGCSAGTATQPTTLTSPSASVTPTAATSTTCPGGRLSRAQVALASDWVDGEKVTAGRYLAYPDGRTYFTVVRTKQGTTAAFMVTGDGPTDGLIGEVVDLESDEEQVSSFPLAALTRAEDPPPESTQQSVADCIEA